MKIAYLVLAHNHPEILDRMARRLTEGTQNLVFAHIDRKVDITPFLAAKTVRFISDRQTVHWAGFSSLAAEMGLLRAALQMGGFDRYVIFQMPAYPAMSNTDIENFFSDPRKEYISALNATVCGSKNHLRKFRCRWYKDTDNPLVKAFEKLKAGLFRLGIVFNTRKPTVFIDGRECPLWCGWAHIALTHAAAEYVTRFYDTHPEFNAFFKTVFAPDESYIHTVLFNSPFYQRCTPTYTMGERDYAVVYFEYSDIVHVFESGEYARIHQSGLPFFRKVDSRSAGLLDFIDSCTS